MPKPRCGPRSGGCPRLCVCQLQVRGSSGLCPDKWIHLPGLPKSQKCLLFARSCGSSKSKIKVSAGQVSSETSLLGLQ